MSSQANAAPRQLMLHTNPVPALSSAGDPALAFFVRRDILGDEPGAVSDLWELPEPRRLLRKQKSDGGWPYPGSNPDTTPGSNYALLETYRTLGILVEMYGFNRSHPVLAAAAEYVFSCQTQEGDIRGILSNQTIPYYHGAILELLIKAGYASDARVERGLQWLLSMRQGDGGWIVPLQAVPSKERTLDIWAGPTISPNRERPSSHLATGMVLRAFAVHPAYHRHAGVLAAAALLKSRLFLADKYNDRKGPEYWLKFQYPFWWTNLLSALDTLSRLDFSAEDPDIRRGLAWFIANQRHDGLWDHGYGAGSRVQPVQRWVALAVCRVFKRLFTGVPDWVV